MAAPRVICAASLQSPLLLCHCRKKGHFGHYKRRIFRPSEKHGFLQFLKKTGEIQAWESAWETAEDSPSPRREGRIIARHRFAGCLSSGFSRGYSWHEAGWKGQFCARQSEPSAYLALGLNTVPGGRSNNSMLASPHRIPLQATIRMMLRCVYAPLFRALHGRDFWFHFAFLLWQCLGQGEGDLLAAPGAD